MICYQKWAIFLAVAVIMEVAQSLNSLQYLAPWFLIFAAVVINFGDFARFVSDEGQMKKGNF